MKRIIEIRDLKKNYGDVEAVKDISFDIFKGEIFGFLGPNGAGKTTTINCICQLNTITSGTVVVNGNDVEKDYLEARRNIGLSPQELQLDMYFTVEEILRYQAGYFGFRKKEAKKRALALLKEFDLLDKRKSYPKELSGGMKRKLSIIKAMIHEPKILILDEPTAALDVDSRYELWEFIKKLNKKGITIILTTHYIEEAEKLADRIGIISKGEIIRLEKTRKIIDELSRNVIVIYLDNYKKLPVEIKRYEYSLKKDRLEIKTSKKEQHKKLSEIMKILEKNDIHIKNFSIQQDNLENIFRRLVNEN